jgi:hypothetical protein
MTAETRSKIGKKSRRKGGAGEREAGRVCEKLWPEMGKFERTSRGIHQDRGDLIPASHQFHFEIEVKRHKTFSFSEYKSFGEVVGRGGVLLFRADNLPWMLVYAYAGAADQFSRSNGTILYDRCMANGVVPIVRM